MLLKFFKTFDAGWSNRRHFMNGGLDVGCPNPVDFDGIKNQSLHERRFGCRLSSGWRFLHVKIAYDGETRQV